MAKEKSKSKSKPKSKSKLISKSKSKSKSKSNKKAVVKLKAKPKLQTRSKAKPKPKPKPKLISNDKSKSLPASVLAKQSVKKNASPGAAQADQKAKPSIKKVDFSQWLTPLDDRILVQFVQKERRTPGGLYIPDTVSDISGNFQGKVVAVGRGHMDKKGKVRPLDVKKGDLVLFSQFSGSKIEIQGEDVLFLRESDVLGIVNN